MAQEYLPAPSNIRLADLMKEHNIALPGGRRVRDFVGIEPLVHPCP